jgi:hypothetical protein
MSDRTGQALDHVPWKAVIIASEDKRESTRNLIAGAGGPQPALYRP